GVRDAWLICKECACETSYFAWCEKDELRLSFRQPADASLQPKEVWARGLYETLVELETDPQLGDLNDRMIVSNSFLHDSEGTHAVTMELRFPDISLSNRDQWELFVKSDAVFADPNAFDVKLGLGAAKGFDLFTDIATAADRDKYIRSHWRDIFYLT